MRCRSLLLCALLAVPVAFAQAPPGYYAPAQGLSGEPLRQALHQIIHNHGVIPYSSTAFDTSDALRVLDEDPANANNVILLYAQRSEPKSTFGLTSGWNREHQWPNSYGLDDVQPAYSDLHNLRAADGTVNSARGNKYYDESNPAEPSYRNPAHAEAPLCSTDSDSWEPPDVVKGDIARSLFYMAIRYTADVPGEPALSLTDAVAQISSTASLMGKLSTLLQWHRADPVSTQERLRNDRVYSLYQGNRNPFVDNPAWIDLTFAPAHTNPPVLTVISAVPLTLAWLATNQTPYTLEMQLEVGSTWIPATNATVILADGHWKATWTGSAPCAFFRLNGGK